MCRAGTCCRRDRPDYTLPAFGSWPGPIYGQLGVLTRDDRSAECHICGRRFRMLAHHVWRAHGLWADEYRSLFGLRAGRGLTGLQTSARLREVARQYLLPHHERAVELARAMTPEERSAAGRGRRLRLETRLDAQFQAAMRERTRKSAERMRERLQDPAELAKVRAQLRPRGPTAVTCAQCGARFLSPAQGAPARAVLLCSDACRRRRKQTLRQARPPTSREEALGRLATAARRRGRQRAFYDRIVARLKELVLNVN